MHTNMRIISRQKQTNKQKPPKHVNSKFLEKCMCSLYHTKIIPTDFESKIMQ